MSHNNRAQIQCCESGLCSVRGAEHVISLILSRRVVYDLLLSYNELGDDGCITLFEFLVSRQGRFYSIVNIELAANGISSKSLPAIAEYLKSSRCLRSLCLQNNSLFFDESIIHAFADALNASNLACLNLATNPELSDPFIHTFLPNLRSHTLRQLNLSSLNITHISLSYLTAYLCPSKSTSMPVISSGAPISCPLVIFSCNANHIGTRNVRTLVSHLSHNYRLTSVSLYANTGIDGAENESSSFVQLTRELLKTTLLRNSFLKKQVMLEALALLRGARAALLERQRKLAFGLPYNTRRDNLLPTELKHYILSFLASTLSPTQIIAVFQYASTASTLPALLPSLLSSPRNNEILYTRQNETGLGLVRKQMERERWLELVRCDVYDPDETRPSQSQ